MLKSPSPGLHPIGGAPPGRDPQSGKKLRRIGDRVHLHYDASRPGKATIAVLPGDVLECSIDVAEQLVAASPQFKQVSSDAAREAVKAAKDAETEAVAEAEAFAAEQEAVLPPAEPATADEPLPPPPFEPDPELIGHMEEPQQGAPEAAPAPKKPKRSTAKKSTGRSAPDA